MGVNVILVELHIADLLIDLTNDGTSLPVAAATSSDAKKMFRRVKKHFFARSGVIAEVDVESWAVSYVDAGLWGSVLSR